jgi:hypothetical protein
MGGQHRVLPRDLGVGVGVAGGHQRPVLVQGRIGVKPLDRLGLDLGESAPTPMVDRCTNRPTPASAAASITRRVPTTFTPPRHGGVDVVGHHRRGVDQHVAPVQQPLPRRRIANVARHDTPLHFGNGVQAHHLGTQAPAAFGQFTAHKAVGAGDEHRASSEGGELAHSVRLYWNCS